MSNYQAVFDAVRSQFHGDFISAFKEAVHFDVSWQVDAVKQEFIAAAQEMARPSVLMKPKLFLDGDSWCALYGENLMDGVAGFGQTPAKAMYEFDLNWNRMQPPITAAKEEGNVIEHN